jgi:hypothetical protein
MVGVHILDRCEVLQPARRAERRTGDPAFALSRGGIPRGAHAHAVREQRRVHRMAESMHCIDAKEQWNVKPRVLDREGLHPVVCHHPVLTRIAGPRVSCINWHVRATGQQGTNVVVDQDRLHRRGIRIAERGFSYVIDQDLIHLAHFFRQCHLAEQNLDSLRGRK